MGHHIYLSGGWKEHKIISAYARHLENEGIEISLDWMKSAAEPNALYDHEIPQKERNKRAMDELSAVARSQFFWFLMPGYNGSRGSWFEFGAACAWFDEYFGDVTRPRIIVVSGDTLSSIFTAADEVQCFPSHGLAYRYIIGLTK